MKKPMRAQETVKPQFNKTLILKVVLSIWLVYHLIVIVVMPNSVSYLGRHYESWLSTYANNLNLNTPWNFFSPDPAQTMYFKYTIYFRNELLEDLKEPVEGYFPKEKDKGAYGAAERRELYAMRYMIIDPKRVDKFLGPWLCKKFEGASSVKLEHVIDNIPPLDRAVYDHKIDVKNMSEQVEVINRDYDCKGQNDEVSS
jgi:hypothetical protein